MRNYIKKYAVFSLVLGLMSGCTGKVLDKDATTPDKAQSFHIERVYQWTRVYDCAGRVKTEGWSTTRSPKTYVSLPPKDYSAYSATYKNEYTASSPCPGFFTSDQYTFAIDLAPGYCTMHSREGENLISYSFYKCDNIVYDVNGAKSCGVPLRLTESGQLYVKITYNEKWVYEPYNQYPSEESCKPSPVPARP